MHGLRMAKRIGQGTALITEDYKTYG